MIQYCNIHMILIYNKVSNHTLKYNTLIKIISYDFYIIIMIKGDLIKVIPHLGGLCNLWLPVPMSCPRSYGILYTGSFLLVLFFFSPFYICNWFYPVLNLPRETKLWYILFLINTVIWVLVRICPVLYLPTDNRGEMIKIKLSKKYHQIQ